MFQALVGDECAKQVQPAEVFHVGQRRQRIVQDIRVSQVERLQVDQGLETGRVFDRGVVEPKMLQLRQGRQSFTPSSPMSSQASVVKPAWNFSNCFIPW